MKKIAKLKTICATIFLTRVKILTTAAKIIESAKKYLEQEVADDNQENN